MRLGALILAGGRSQRMGRPKESLLLGGETLLFRVARVLLECADPVVVVARDGQQQLPSLPNRVAIVHDEPPSRGPLAAIATGLLHGADADAMFVTGCDSPFLRSDDVRWLASWLAEHDVVMPVADGVLQPLCAIYRVSVVSTAKSMLERGETALRELARECDTRLLSDDELAAHDPDKQLLRNINTPEDYERARAEL